MTTLDGAVVATTEGTRVSTASAGKSLREGFRTEFSLASLKPGRYVLTVAARSSMDEQRDPVSRQIPFEIVN